MRAGDSYFKGLPRSYKDIVLLLTMIGVAVYLLMDHLILLLEKEAGLLHLFLVIAGMALVVLGCLGVYLRFRQETLEIKATLEEKTNALIKEQELRQKVEVELQDLLGSLDRRTVDPILLSTVIEQTEDNVLITDSHRTILYVNPAFERSCGYTCEELKGKPLRYLRSDQHDNSFFHAMKEILDRGEVWTGVIVNKGKDGIDFEIEGTISPIRDESGVVSYWVAIGRNMSRFRKLERELQRVQKMNALGTLAGGIAHDFNNILTAIMGLIELEQLEAQAGSRTHHRMTQALSACGRARDLVRQILTFSSKGEQRRKPLCIFSVIDESLKMLRATLPTTITIKTDFKATASLILGDSTQIQQIFVNLCTNAAYAMRLSGGILGIGLHEVTLLENQIFEHPDLSLENYVLFTVSDTGTGMNQGVRDRIFEPFFSTKGPGEGSGIGLSVVHGIVESHGGRISVQSEPGKGSKFEIFFPRIEGIEELQPTQPELPPPGTERILVVDDEEMVVAVASDMLTALGYEVVTAARGAEALELFRVHPKRFHLIITDQTMPGITGMELAAELLRIRKDIPIILCTGLANASVSDTALNIGIRKIMSKPFVMQELATAVRNVLDSFQFQTKR